MSGIMLAAASGAASGLTVTLSPANATTGGTSGGHVQAMTAIPAGGVGPFTYAWTVQDEPPAYLLTINSPAAATTDFDFTPAVASGSIAQGTVRCTVTDTGTGLTGYAEGLVTHVDQRARPPGGGGGVIP